MGMKGGSSREKHACIWRDLATIEECKFLKGCSSLHIIAAQKQTTRLRHVCQIHLGVSARFGVSPPHLGRPVWYPSRFIEILIFLFYVSSTKGRHSFSQNRLPPVEGIHGVVFERQRSYWRYTRFFYFWCFLFPRWDILVSWRVAIVKLRNHASSGSSLHQLPWNLRRYRRAPCAQSAQRVRQRMAGWAVPLARVDVLPWGWLELVRG